MRQAALCSLSAVHQIKLLMYIEYMSSVVFSCRRLGRTATEYGNFEGHADGGLE